MQPPGRFHRAQAEQRQFPAALAVLALATVLSVYKPRGKTAITAGLRTSADISPVP